MPRASKKGGKKKKSGNSKASKMTIEERTAAAKESLDKGNVAFKSANYDSAALYYSEALKMDPSNVDLYAARCAAYLKQAVMPMNENKEGHLKQAVTDAKKCVSLKPDWGKGWCRMGQCRLVGADGNRAADAFRKGLEVDPLNQVLEEGLAESKRMIAKGMDKKIGTGRRGRADSDDDDDAPSILRSAAAGGALDDAGDMRLDLSGKAVTAAALAGVSDVIGIDLGTTYSCVGVWRQGKVEIIANAEGKRTTPSCVAFGEEERYIGDAAKAQAAANPYNTIYDVKRMIGQRFEDEKVQADVAHFGYKVVEGKAGKPKIVIADAADGAPAKDDAKRAFTPEEISAMILGRMKKIAEDYLDKPVHKAVITVPAYFSDAQRQATKDAGAIAGLQVLRIINEPTAAALAYGLDNANETKDKLNVLVFDLGGGTFDVSLLNIDNGMFKVMATAGDTHLGGEDFDNAMCEYVSGEFMKKHKGEGNPRENARAMKRLKHACERAKRTLSSAPNATIELDSFMGDVDFSITVSKAKFNQLQNGLFMSCLDTVKKVLKDAKMEKEGINDIVLVGGSTRIPRVQELLRQFFDGKELCKTINPDEAVAYGAAVQGAILAGVRNDSVSSLLLVDVTPLSLGIETTGGVMSTIIKRNTAIPVRKTKTYTTEADYQTEIEVEIYEGERQTTSGNNLLGQFEITGIERAKRGQPQIDVTFELDADGVLQVTAKDQTTGAEAGVKISKNAGRLSEEEIQKMILDAEKYKKEDQQILARVDARNELERTVYANMDRISGAIQKGRKSAKLQTTLSSLADVRRWMEANQDASVAELGKMSKSVEEMMEDMHR